MPIAWKTSANHIYHSLRGIVQNLGVAVVVDSAVLPAWKSELRKVTTACWKGVVRKGSSFANPLPCYRSLSAVFPRVSAENRVSERVVNSFAVSVRSERVPNDQSPNFSNFAPNFPRNFPGLFVLCFPENEDHQNSPQFFNAKSPGKVKERIHKGLLQGVWQANSLPYALQPHPRCHAQLCPKLIEREEKTPTPKSSALLRKRPVLLRAKFVLTKDRKRPYYGHFGD